MSNISQEKIDQYRDLDDQVWGDARGLDGCKLTNACWGGIFQVGAF